MKRAFYTIAISAVTGVSLIGCANKKTSSIPTSESVADISPAPPPAPTPAPVATTPQPVAPQPVVYDSVQTSTAASGGTYTVRKGDTLYSIARARYGDGKQWNRIVAANPGLQPQSLKVGQTITIP